MIATHYDRAAALAVVLADDLMAQNATHLWVTRLGPTAVAVDGRPDLLRLARLALEHRT